MLALIFITGQAGLYFYARSVAMAAAQEGTRAAAAATATAADGDSAAQAFLSRAGSDLLHAPTVTARRTPTQVHVTITGRSLSLVPGYPGFAVTQSASSPVERVS